jgi:hypothetical protein
MDLILQNLVSYIGESAPSPAPAGDSGTSCPPIADAERTHNIESVDGEMAYGVIVFSKGRPTQLAILLRSIECFLVSPAPAMVQVIFLDDGYSKAYECVQSKFPCVLFIQESNFQRDLQGCIEKNLKATRATPAHFDGGSGSIASSTCSSSSSMRGGAVLFCVDDLVFFRRVEMKYVI